MDIWNKEIRKDVWVKTISGILVAIILAAIFSMFDKVKQLVFPKDPVTNKEQLDSHSQIQGEKNAIEKVPIDNIPFVDTTKNSINKNDLIVVKPGRLIIDTEDNREIKLIDYPIAFFLPLWWQKLIGWFLVIYPFFIYPLAFFSDSRNWLGWLGCLVFPIIFTCFFLIVGFGLSLILNYVMVKMFDWIPAQYALYKLEVFLNWIWGHL